MNRLLSLAYGIAVYASFAACALYSVAFIGDFALTHTLDRGPESSLGTALLINLGVLGVFGLQHSVMARPAWKRMWTRIVPQVIERSTYVLATVAALALIYAMWRPIPAVVWHVEIAWARALLWAGYFGGWGVMVYATFLLDHFDLTGLRQVVVHWKREPQANKGFRTPSLYTRVRHPIYVGWVMIFWITPTMTVGHLLFAAVTTLYMVIAIQLEERDLVAELGEPYRRYQARVPMLIPRLRRAPASSAEDLATR